MNAINNNQMTMYQKVFCAFSEPFWHNLADKDLDYVHIATETKGLYSTFVILKGTNTPSYVENGVNMGYFTLVGEHAWRVQELTDQ